MTAHASPADAMAVAYGPWIPYSSDLAAALVGGVPNNPFGLAYTVSDLGGNVLRTEITGDGTARDGFNECLRWDLGLLSTLFGMGTTVAAQFRVTYVTHSDASGIGPFATLGAGTLVLSSFCPLGFGFLTGGVGLAYGGQWGATAWTPFAAPGPAMTGIFVTDAGSSGITPLMCAGHVEGTATTGPVVAVLSAPGPHMYFGLGYDLAAAGVATLDCMWEYRTFDPRTAGIVRLPLAQIPERP